MAFLSEHEKDCIAHLGKPYTDVHMFLDKYASLFNVGFFDEYHRTFLHNSYGIECSRSLWGIGGWKAAKLHLIRDFIMKPIDSKDFKRFMTEGSLQYQKMMVYYNNPKDLQIHHSVIEAWIKEGFGLVTLATKYYMR